MGFFNINFEKINLSRRLNHKIENKEQKENLENIYENILQHSFYVDKGRNGIITKINFKSVSQKELKILFNLNNDFFEKTNTTQQGIALKLLKIYTQGEGKKEFELQKEAIKILNTKLGVAKIPPLIAFREIIITHNELKRKLKYWGVKLPQVKFKKEIVDKYLLDQEYYDEIEYLKLPLNVQRKIKIETNFSFPQVKIEVLAMNYIKGEDLGKILLKEVLLRHNQCHLSFSEINEMHFDRLMEKTEKLLNFKKIDWENFYSANSQKQLLIKQKLREENAQKMIHFLKKTNYHFNPDWLRKIRRSIQLLHNHNIYHRDLHERNIIIANNGEVYIIDFGNGIKVNDEVKKEEDIYKNNEKKIQYIRDEKIIKRYQALL